MSNRIRLSLGIKYENNLSSGKHKFANRLIKVINEYANDIQIVPRLSESDVHITFDGKIKPGAKNIYRIDGVWINSSDNDQSSKNNQILLGLKQSNGVIYQSEFCEEAVSKFLGFKKKQSAIIYNGADPVEFIKNPKYKPKMPAFIAMCKWRPHKRLDDVVNGFLNSKVKDVTQLHVYGDVESKIKKSNIVYHGWGNDISKLLPWCIASVHISYLDWCPNAVVESLVAGVPVIYSNSGGTPYLVKDDGFMVSDHKWEFNSIPLYDKHPLSISEISSAYENAYASNKRVNRPDLFIHNVAEKYIDFIKQVANSK